VKQLAIMALALAVLFLVACSDEQQTEMKQTLENSNETAKKLAADVARWSGEQWDSFVASSGEALGNLQQDWSALQESLSQQWSGAQEGIIADLRKNIDSGLVEFDKVVAQMRTATGDQWETLKQKSEQLQKDLSGWMSDLSKAIDSSSESDSN